MRQLLFTAAILALVAAQAHAATDTGSVGAVLLAHGGSAQWNRNVEGVKRSLEQAGYPVEIAFGMADSKTIGAAVQKLEARRVAGVVCLSLLANSHSELYDQFAYILGARPKPSQEFLEAMKILAQDHAGHRHSPAASAALRTEMPLHLSPAMDDHPYVVRILLDRARQISRQPEMEVILLVSHGPYTDEAEKRWMKISENTARWIEKLGGFVRVKAFNLRDDSPKKVQEIRAQILRQYAMGQAKKGRKILVLPHLVSMNGIEQHISKALTGVSYKMAKEALLPHPLAAKWALEQIEEIYPKEE